MAGVVGVPEGKELGYPHELWTTRLLARHAREQGPAEGHACLANLAQDGLQDPRPGGGQAAQRRYYLKPRS